MDKPQEKTQENPMEDHAKDLSSLTDDDLRQKLQQYGESVGPITATTRRLLEKKLCGLIYGKNVENSDAVQQTEGENNNNGKSNGQSPPEDHSSASSSNSNSGNTPTPSSYFGVVLPVDVACPDKAEDRVFTETSEVLKYTKKTVGARFKVFPTHEQALEFAKGSSDPIKEPKKEDTGESSSFRGPRIQELVKLRKGIETGNQLLIRELVWSNPRYLISSGDTPTILQEGFRYNAFHTAAMKNQGPICRYLLSTLGDPRYLQLLYPQDTEDMRDERMQHLLDLYLNMPDKGYGETPLHFACKFGHHEVVKVLASHPLTDRTRKNRDGLTPAEIICSRATDACKELREQIRDMLEGQCYVPLLRSIDNTAPAMVGEAWSPENGAPVPSQIGVLLSESPQNPAVVVKAFAGPMSPSQAKVFRKQWLTPPSPNPKDVKEYNKVRCGDSDKGLERLGRKLAKELGLPWQEYWDFLGGFTDLCGEDGLDQLEHYLAEKYEAFLSRCHLDNEIEQLEAKLRAFHVTSPESPQNHGILGAIYQEHYTQTPVTQNTTPLGASPLFKSTPAKPLPSGKKDDFIKYFDFGEPVLDPGNSNRFHHCRVVVDDNQRSVSSLGLEEATSEVVNLDLQNSGDGCDEIFSPPLLDIPGSPRRCHNDSISSVDSDCESYYTAKQSAPPASTRDGDEDEDHDETIDADGAIPDVNVFIFGDEPSKFDIDVFNAVSELDLSPQHYPNIYKWKKKIMTHPEIDRARWKTPRRLGSISQTGGSSTPPPSSPLASPRFNRVRTNLTKSFAADCT